MRKKLDYSKQENLIVATLCLQARRKLACKYRSKWLDDTLYSGTEKSFTYSEESLRTAAISSTNVIAFVIKEKLEDMKRSYFVFWAVDRRNAHA